MLNLQDELIISNNGQGMYEITNNIHDWIVKNNIIKGQLNLFIQHTSASLTIMENASTDVLEDINRQIMLMETQLTSSKFLGISLADLFYQKINVQSSIDTMEIDYVTGNLQLKLLAANLVSFIAQKDIIN